MRHIAEVVGVCETSAYPGAARVRLRVNANLVLSYISVGFTARVTVSVRD